MPWHCSQCHQRALQGARPQPRKTGGTQTASTRWSDQRRQGRAPRGQAGRADQPGKPRRLPEEVTPAPGAKEGAAQTLKGKGGSQCPGAKRNKTCSGEAPWDGAGLAGGAEEVGQAGPAGPGHQAASVGSRDFTVIVLRCCWVSAEKRPQAAALSPAHFGCWVGTGRAGGWSGHGEASEGAGW